jgi:hypothetical protein
VQDAGGTAVVDRFLGSHARLRIGDHRGVGPGNSLGIGIALGSSQGRGQRSRAGGRFPGNRKAPGRSCGALPDPLWTTDSSGITHGFGSAITAVSVRVMVRVIPWESASPRGGHGSNRRSRAGVPMPIGMALCRGWDGPPPAWRCGRWPPAAPRCLADNASSTGSSGRPRVRIKLDPAVRMRDR